MLQHLTEFVHAGMKFGFQLPVVVQISGQISFGHAPLTDVMLVNSCFLTQAKDTSVKKVKKHQIKEVKANI